MRLPVLLSCLCLLALFSGCLTGSVHNEAYPKAFSAPPQLAPQSLPGKVDPSSVTGFWQGVSSADCLTETGLDPGRCHATQKITLTMVQQGESVTGFYRCAYGNQVCRNLDEEGVIRNGKMNGRRLFMRVMLEDGSMCFFTGMPLNGVIEGRYSCLQGGGLVERGAFRTVRAY
jgi:hypothetical protein